MREEIQLKDDDLLFKIDYDRQIYKESKDRFMKFISDNKDQLSTLSALDFNLVTGEVFDWAWMNVGTRCFGTYHLPHELAMVPLLDLMNHSPNDDKLQYFLYPLALNIKMLEHGDNIKINKELELDYQAEKEEFEDYDASREWESQDFDQHWDDYGDRYYNYLPKIKKEKLANDSESEEEKDEDKYVQHDSIDKFWDLKNENIYFGKRIMNKERTEIQKGEELNLCYGERANSFLLLEYGFTIPENRYDFCRLPIIKYQDVKESISNCQGIQIDSLRSQKELSDLLVETYKMKSEIRIDLKHSGLHRDLLRYLRCAFKYDNNTQSRLQSEANALRVYKNLCKSRLSQYPTTLNEDRQLLLELQKPGSNYFWMYQYLMLYRIGQKEILTANMHYCDKSIYQLQVLINKNGNITDEIIDETLQSINNMSSTMSEMSVVSKDNSMHYESDDLGINKQRSSSISPSRYDASPKTYEQIQQSLKNEIQMKKEKNEANQQLAKFKKSLQKQDTGNSITTSTEKIAYLPKNLREDLQEAVLYAYFAVRYYDEHIFKVIVTRTNKFQADRDLNQLLGKERSFISLSLESSYSRYRLNQSAFEIAIEKDYFDVAFHFIETGQVHITWEMIRKMISRRQEYLVKQCIKYGSKFDPGSASLKKIVFAGRTAAPLEDRTIKLVDFIQVMLDLKWKSKQIQEVLVNYAKKGKIDSRDIRELFLMFAVKRKIKLMSFLINNEQFMMEFQEDNFVDIIENDAYDMGVLLYREYFLQINQQHDKLVTLLVNAFTKTNGLLEAKCFLLKRFINKMNFDQANKFLEAVEERVNDSSKGNILILTLNAVKATCLLVELLENVKKQFSFLSRRVFEIRQKLVKIANQFMNEIQSEEEMRFYLLEKDLDERDSLNIIYDCEIIELLENPFAQNIVQQIWSSQYNNSHSLFTVSSVHQMLFNYNHCRYDQEENLRFYKKRDLSKYGCHGFQFQVWRFSGESRHLVSSITTLIFVIIFHIIIVNHMTYVLDMLDSKDQIVYWRQQYDTAVVEKLPFNNVEFRKQNLIIWYMKVYKLQRESLLICGLMHLSWMYLLQHIFNVVFATKNKRFTHLVNVGNFLDFVMFLISLVYVFAYYKGWRYDTFLQILDPPELGEAYWNNYLESAFNENALLLSYGFILWCKVVYCFKLFYLTSGIFAIIVKLVKQMFTFAIFYFSVLFLYAVVGVVLFSDLPEFAYLQTAMFTLFKATISDYDTDKMDNARIGAFLGYCYYVSFLILNLILIMNLIVARLAHAYKYYNSKRDVLKLLATLSVREVSEADEKYSAVISAPFPLNMLNFVLGSTVISLKSPKANIALLNLYYIPISTVCIIVFIVYQVLIYPFCYIKMVGHKFALMVKSPQGQGARTTLDRAGQALLFIIFGPILLLLAMIVDIAWFIFHLYKMDLDKSNLQNQQTTELNRRTYKKMISYFEQKNEQLVPQKRVAEDLRNYLDVMEGIRCIVYGRPKNIPNDKIGLYITYARQYIKEADGKKSVKFELLDEGLDTKDDVVEQVVKEFQVVKQVLLNNSIPVDMREIQQNSVKKKGWGMRLLFDKKTFYSLLLDLERMRKVLQLKKSLFIFHIPYEGKQSQITGWHKKVEQRITQTLKFLNTARLLKIIGYDPAYHIKMDNINLAIGQSPNKAGADFADQLGLNQIKIDLKSKPFSTKKNEREENLSGNMNFIINKYQNSARQMRELTDIVRRLNVSNQQLQIQQENFLHQSVVNKENNNPRSYVSYDKNNDLVSKDNLNMSFNQAHHDQDQSFNYDSNLGGRQSKHPSYVSPQKVDISPKGVYVAADVRRGNMHVQMSDKNDSEGQVSSDEEQSNRKRFNKDQEIGMSKGRRKIN